MTQTRKPFWKLLSLLRKNEPGNGASTGLTLRGKVMTSGKKRHYLLYVPKSYQPGKAHAPGHQLAWFWRMANTLDEHQPVERSGR